MCDTPPQSSTKDNEETEVERSHSVSPQRSISWYYSTLYPGYKKRKQEFRDLFSPVCSEERFVVDYSCALHKDILHQGRLYLTTKSIAFYSYILGWENKIQVPWEDVKSMSKEKIALFIPNAIQIITKDDKMFFASFVDRDSSFLMIQRLWQAKENESPIPDKELDSIIACEYGEDEKIVEKADQSENDNNDEDEEKPQSQEDFPVEDDDRLNNWLNEVDESKTIPVCDRLVPHSASSLFSLIYSNSDFYFSFQKERGTTELEIGEWEGEGDSSKIREVRYNMSMNIPVGPRNCEVKETQQLKSSSSEETMFCVETKAKSSGVPYADAFTVVTNSCLLETVEGKSRLIARAEIRFEKDLWGFLKEKIESNALNGLKSHYKELVEALETFDEDNPLTPGCVEKHFLPPTDEVADTQEPSLWQQHPHILIFLIFSILLSFFSMYTLYRVNSKFPEASHELPESLSIYLDRILRYQRFNNKMKAMLLEAMASLEQTRNVLDQMAQLLDELEKDQL